MKLEKEFHQTYQQDRPSQPIAFFKIKSLCHTHCPNSFNQTIVKRHSSVHLCKQAAEIIKQRDLKFVRENSYNFDPVVPTYDALVKPTVLL